MTKQKAYCVISALLLLTLMVLAGDDSAASAAQDRDPNPATTPEATPQTVSAFGISPQDIANQILASPELMQRVEALASDPQVQAVLADPEVAEALEKNEWLKLVRNSKIRELARQPRIRALARDIIVELLPGIGR
jgi:hypothetical protein